MATFSLNSSVGGVSNITSSLNSQNPVSMQQQASYESNGGIASSNPAAPGNTLPYTNIVPEVDAQMVRNIITWFVPQFGTVKMFVNPENITYNHSKLITKDKTKGGFTLQYWGEELSTLDIKGTTGSSGIEGINMLYEVYRSEQYAFDAVGLTLAANNASADINNNLSQGIGGAVGQLIGNTSTATSSGGILGGILGLDSPNNSLSARNVPSLASLAFAVEMYYNVFVYRGYFNSMTVNEQSNDFLLHYDMKFTVTQRRGYRTNYFPWSNSPVSGASSYTTPPSFSGNTEINTNVGAPDIAQEIGSILSVIL